MGEGDGVEGDGGWAGVRETAVRAGSERWQRRGCREWRGRRRDGCASRRESVAGFKRNSKLLPKMEYHAYYNLSQGGGGVELENGLFNVSN